MFGADNIFVVSKAGYKISQRSNEWMQHNKFFDKTGINPSNVHFCKERPQKGSICSKLSITHFIDDRMDVLNCMPNSVKFRFLFKSSNKNYQKNKSVIVVENWSQMLNILQQQYLE